MSGLLLWLAGGLLIVPLLIYTIEVFIGLPRLQVVSPIQDCSVAILIPAHDEARGIRSTLCELLAVAPPGCRIVVVADNCNDDTATIARSAGVTAIERHDPERRGKGYALNFGRAFLAQYPPDAVVILDADCRAKPGSIERLAAVACRTGQPAQGVNTLEPDRTASPLVQISSFSFLVKNLVRARGIFRSGGLTLLTGTGMAFPWPLFRDASLATESIVEDLALGVELTLKGYRTLLVGDAGVTSPSAHRQDLLDQRARWERGFVDVARRWALPLLAHGTATGSRASLVLGLHLLVPPLAMLIAVSAVGLAALGAAALLGASAAPAIALGLALAAAMVATLAAWGIEGRGTLTARALLMAPLYVLWKIPMYLKFLRGAPPKWMRTRRRAVPQADD